MRMSQVKREIKHRLLYPYIRKYVFDNRIFSKWNELHVDNINKGVNASDPSMGD